MNKILPFCMFMLCGLFGFSQINVELISHVDFVAEGKGEGNDIWGYVAPDGTEYGIVGTTAGTLVYSLEDPANPIERAFIPGSNSTWRDMKQWGEYAYVTCDAGNDGFLIIDMSQAPDTIKHVFRKPTLPGSNGDITLETCHNIYIDENGIIYLAGCGGRGCDIFDPNIDPWDPPLVGYIEGPYHHDDYAKGDTLYASRILDGDLAIFDVKDKANPVLLGTINTSSNFTHNTWVDATHTYAYTTDERAEGFVDSYDVSDPSNIKFLDKIQPPGTKGTGTIPHNTHYFNGYLVTSWYTSGLVVIDGTRPENLVQVAHYDTYDGPDGGFFGCWGTTPYLPSGIVLANDINSGFYVFDVDYKRACYLEGTVTDKSTGATINNVEITVVDAQYDEDLNSNALGRYKYGQPDPGTFDVEFSHPAYEPLTLSATLENGVVTILDAELVSKPTYEVTFNVISKTDGSGIGGASLELTNEGLPYQLKTDDSGVATGTLIGGDYNIYAGKWGFENIGLFSYKIEENGSVTIELAEVYMDDFALDLGWTVENEELGNFSGGWERGIPVGTFDNGVIFNPNVDVDGDVGSKCYVTENAADANSTFSHDVDNGITTLTSPVMDLTTYIDPTVEYALWFMNASGGGTPNDELEVFISNGQTEVLLTSYTSDGTTDYWTVPYEEKLVGKIDITDSMRLIVKTSDLPGEGHIAEAGFDQFIVRGAPQNVTDLEDDMLSIYPNPATTSVVINSDQHIEAIEMFNSLGQKVLVKESIFANQSELNVSKMVSGSYVVVIKLEDSKSVVRKIQIVK